MFVLQKLNPGFQKLLLQMISWDRYNVIVNGFKGTPLTFSKAIIMIIFSWVIALSWSVSPLVGWGYYGILLKK